VWEPPGQHLIAQVKRGLLIRLQRIALKLSKADPTIYQNHPLTQNQHQEKRVTVAQSNPVVGKEPKIKTALVKEKQHNTIALKQEPEPKQDV